jgi:hypothetical protein
MFVLDVGCLSLVMAYGWMVIRKSLAKTRVILVRDIWHKNLGIGEKHWQSTFMYIARGTNSRVVFSFRCFLLLPWKDGRGVLILLLLI